MSKERFEWLYNETMLKHYMVDNQNNIQLGYEAIVNLLNQQNKQISDLEAKLAESNESHHKNIVELTKIVTEKDRKIEELKHQLAEKQSKIQELNDMYEDLLVAKGTENELMQVSADCDFFAKENRKLKQQLAEKEKLLKKYLATSCPIYKDKISFAVEQLEKVKEWCENHEFSDKDDYIITYEPDEEDASGCVDYLKDFIDNQIEELKKEMK